MRETVTLYTRDEFRAFSRVPFKNGKPSLPKNYEGRFYLRYHDAATGKRKWDSYPELDEALAVRDNLDREREGLAPLPVVQKLEETAERLTIAKAVAQFIERNNSRVEDWRSGGDYGLSPGSSELYKKAVEDFQASCAAAGVFYVDQINKAVLMKFKVWLREKVARRGGKSAYTDSKKFVILGQFLVEHGIKLSKDKKKTLNDPGLLDWVEIPRVKKPKAADVVYYTPADITAMLAAAASVHENSLYGTEDLKDLVLTLLWTGMRDEELQHLEWSDIVWKNGDGRGKILIQDKPLYDWRVKDHEKRVIAMSDKLRNRLQTRQKRTGETTGLIFSTGVGTPNQNFAEHILGLQKRAIAAGYTFSRPEVHRHILHNFRHSYATFLGVNSEPVRNIQHALGHSDLTTTERYLALVEDPERVRQEYDKI